MRAVQIIDGAVAGVYMVESLALDFLPDLVASETAVTGDLYDPESGGFTAPPTDATEPPAPVVPQEVTRRQGLRALFLVGVTEAMVEDFIAAIEDETARALALIDFRAAGTFMRHDPLVLAAGAHFDLDLDELFTHANSL